MDSPTQITSDEMRNVADVLIRAKALHARLICFHVSRWRIARAKELLPPAPEGWVLTLAGVPVKEK